ncbi:hypothetical protein L3556_13245 [Candidatus Synechococcus calcipolaris G9]|uniref:Uncharacterized protein n=1 Tax=Candidatus Synechococcus calcipolaris G9 TaxID=1497997 RepID=A0ABT6F282_9SYNE|nr:hypothetical protein [Candidatus Synechococcus calcipolaris]MDG2991888.1 hypothetical protein [Candidatus Synechococcus calcipolaris G9]
MKHFLATGSFTALSFLCLTTAAFASPAPSLDSDGTQSTYVTASVKFPSIVGAKISGSNHVITISGNGMSLRGLAIALPKQMENFTDVTIQNGSGGFIPAMVERQDGRLMILFAAPVVANSILNVQLNDVQMRTKGGEQLPYGVKVMQTGTNGDISIGTALISVPNRD